MSNLALQSEGSRSTDCPACPGKPVLDRIQARTSQIGEASPFAARCPTASVAWLAPGVFSIMPAPLLRSGKGCTSGHIRISLLQTFTCMIQARYCTATVLV